MAKNTIPKFESINDLLGAPEIVNGSEEIGIESIVPFKNHPFKVLDDEKMDELVESIKLNGILTPVLVRPVGGIYEMISGHRRLHAAKLAGLTKVPAIVKELADDDAALIMIDSNVQREEILPSERAFSLKMKMDIMKRQGKRNDLTSGHDVQKFSADSIGEENGISGRQVKRYIRLTELLPELLQLVDDKAISLVMGVDISFFNKEVQGWILEYFNEHKKLKNKQIAILRSNADIENMTHEEFLILMEGQPKPKEGRKVSFSDKKLDRYFPSTMASSECEAVIISLLEKWKQEQE